MKFIQKIIDNLIEKYVVPRIVEEIQFETNDRMKEIDTLKSTIQSHNGLLKGIDNNLAVLELDLREHIDVEIEDIPDEENIVVELDPTSQLVVNLLEDSINQIKQEGLSISEINRIINTLTTYKNEKVNVSLNKKDNPISRVKLI